MRQVAEKMHLQIDLFNSLPYRFYFVEDCCDQSQLILVVHQAYMDIAQMFQILEKSTGLQRRVIDNPPENWLFEAIMRFLGPLVALRLLLHFYFLPISLNTMCCRRVQNTKSRLTEQPKRLQIY